MSPVPPPAHPPTTWTKQNMFDPATIERSTGIPFKDRMRLLFRKRHHSCDIADGRMTITTFKRMSGKTYVLKVKFYD